MVPVALVRRLFPGAVVKPACGAVAICSLALLAALSVGADADKPANASKTAPKSKVADDEPKEAPTGFTNTSNGFENQDDFDRDRKKFEEVETILPEKTSPDSGRKKTAPAKRRQTSAGSPSDQEEASSGGLGPVYNGTSCVGCHQNPVTGSSSQVSEIRAGHLENGMFVEPPGGSLIHQRAIDAAAQEHVPPDENVPLKDRKRTLRMSTNILGDGFVEVIPDKVFQDIQRKQPEDLRGLAVVVPVAVKGKKISDREFTFEIVERFGRFGWKCQEASLINFSAGAYLNEMGITNPLQLKENRSNGRDVSQFDRVLDPEDEDDNKDPDHPFGNDVKAFARFMRSTEAPSRDFSLASTDDVKAGEKIFMDLDKNGNPLGKGVPKLGCAICHHPCYTTPPAGTSIETLDGKLGSDLGTVPAELGNKIIHPYSDFMLHNIGSGDGIAQTQHANKPPTSIEKLQRLPADIVPGKGIVRVRRVQAHREDGKKRAPGDICPEVESSANLDQSTINMIRTAPLWGLRVRPQMMHDGLSLTLEEAIVRHTVPKTGDVELPANFTSLTDEQKRQLKAFLNSL